MKTRSVGDRPARCKFVSAVDALRSLDPDLERAAQLKVAHRDDGPGGDAALVARLRAHVAGARRDVVRLYGGSVRAILIRVLGANDPERADLMQEVFLRVFAGLDTLDDPQAFRAWVSRIAVLVAREHIRRRQRQRWFMRFGEPPDVPAAIAGEGVREAVRSVYA
ncbi:MAG TPA: sigma-70 family RNA polymerase sigma factor, partial [Polyangia bacterium]